MKKILIFTFLLCSLFAGAAKYYISPTGSDDNDGTLASPFFTLNKAWTVVSAGDTVYLRGGTYSYTTQQVMTGKNGISGSYIKVWAYPGETPVISKGSGYTYNNDYGYGVYLSGNYVHFKGLDISGYSQETPEVWHGFRVYGDNNIFERLNIHHNGAGMLFGDYSTGNLILNCDFHHNSDPLSPTPYNNGDGLQIAYVAAGTSNTIRGCRAWWNVDDGFDFYNNEGNIILDSCWAFYNGYLPDTFTPARDGTGDGNGIKLGDQQTSHSDSTLRTMTRCLIYHNRSFGIANNSAQCRVTLYNSTCYSNGNVGISLGAYDNICRNNISYANSNINAAIDGHLYLDHNSFTETGGANASYSITAADFVSLDSTQLVSSRQASGSLPVITFLTLAQSSDAVDGGIDVGLAYAGTAPDIGALEYGYASGGGGTTPSTSSPPVIIKNKGKVVLMNKKLVIR